MSTPHTPGPWRISTIGSYGIAITGYTSVIANVPDDDAIGNARLIAAAPELLAALREITSHATNFGGAPLSATKMFDRARAAIAKATGAV
jgi:hypothetical protein